MYSITALELNGPLLAAALMVFNRDQMINIDKYSIEIRIQFCIQDSIQDSVFNQSIYWFVYWIRSWFLFDLIRLAEVGGAGS
jgi:hypothetical protein